MASNAQRQREFRLRCLHKGQVTVTGLVPAKHHAAVQELMRFLCENPHLEVGPCRDPASGRFVKLP